MIFEPSGAMAPETHAHLRKLDKIGRDNPAARDGTRYGRAATVATLAVSSPTTSSASPTASPWRTLNKLIGGSRASSSARTAPPAARERGGS